jgi:hypothetical protein
MRVKTMLLCFILAELSTMNHHPIMAIGWSVIGTIFAVGQVAKAVIAIAGRRA